MKAISKPGSYDGTQEPVFKVGGHAGTALVLTTDARIADTVLTLTDGASIAWDATTRNAVVTLGGNRTLSNPTNLTTGGLYVLEVIQDGTGGRTLAYGSTFIGVPPIDMVASRKTVLVWQYDGSKLVLISPNLTMAAMAAYSMCRS